MRLSLLLLFCLCSFISFSQGTDSIKMEIGYAESKDMVELLEFQEISFLKFRLNGEILKDANYYMTATKYIKGQVDRKDTLVNTEWLLMKHNSETLNIHVMAAKEGEDSLKMQFKMPSVYFTKKFAVEQKDRYTLKSINIEEGSVFSAKQPITLMVYTQPYPIPDKPGYFSYCELSREGIPPEKWYKEFGVEHYIVFSLLVEGAE